MTEKTDAELAECFGNQKVLKLQRGGYQTSCHKSCPLFEACISKSREDTEDREYEAIQIPYSSLVMTKKEKENLDESMFFEKLFHETETTGGADSFDYLLKHLNVEVELRPFAISFIERFANFYHDCPEICNAIMCRIFNGQNQSDIAKQRGMTRQAINYRIMKEAAGITRAEIPHIPEELTGQEIAVYKLCYVDGCTERSAAMQLGMSQPTIHRIRKSIAKK